MTKHTDVFGLCYDCYDNGVGESFFHLGFLQSLSPVFESHIYLITSSKKGGGEG